jgi:hypothetical protein
MGSAFEEDCKAQGEKGRKVTTWQQFLLGGAIALSVFSLFLGARALEQIADQLKRMNDNKH